MADGGEGTVDAVISATAGERVTSTVTGPRGSDVEAEWGFIPAGENRPATAVIEMAQASGIELLEPEQRNPMKTTTYGTGELIREAVQQGAERIIVGIGGSATVDGGMGMARALGYQCLDASGDEVVGGGGALERVARISDEHVIPQLHRVTFDVACDVDNPLLGEHGAARVYGPQKGASDGQVETLEANLNHWADVVESWRDQSYREEPGAGAAGGLGFGLISLLGAELTPGARLVMDVTGLPSKLSTADAVVTGEGCIDGQTVRGKTPYAVARAASDADVPFVAGIAGSLGSGYRDCFEYFDWLMALPVSPMSLSESMEQAPSLLRERSRDLSRLIDRVV